MDSGFLVTTHSLLRYAILLTVAYAALAHMIGRMQGRPILNLHRMAAIVSVVLAHTQLVIGLILYATRFSTYGDLEGRARTFWKFEHIGTMIIAVVLITLGRSLSKRSNDQRVKQMRVAVFFLIALALMLWATPWPFTTIGHGRQWL